MITRSSSICIRMPNDLLQKLEDLVQKDKFPNISEAIRKLIESGIWVESNLPKIKDPEFIKSLEKIKQTEGIIQQIDVLDDSQIDGLLMAFQFEKEKRWKNRTNR